MSPKVGVVSFLWTVGLNDENLPAVAAKAAQAGADVLEIAFLPASALDGAKAERALADAGIGASVLTILGTDADTSSSQDEARQAGITHIKAAIDFAAAVGSPVLMGPMQRPLNSASITAVDVRAAHLERAAEALRDVGAHAAERGIQLAIEPLNRFEIDLVNTVADGLALCDAIDLENVGLGLDVFHLNIEERDVAAAIRDAGSRLKHLHVPDTDRGVPGTAHAPWQDISDALGDVSFDGIATFESWAGDLEAGWRMWRPYFGDRDAAARAAVQFLRTNLT